MPFNTYADIQSFVGTVFADAMLVARENAIMTALVTDFNDRRSMAIRTNAKYGSATLNQIAETDDLTSQAFTPSTDQSLTPYEYGAQFFFTDQRIDSDIYAVQQDATQELGGAYGQKVDTDLVGLFSSLTAGTVGAGTTTDMKWATFFAAESILRNAHAPLPYVCVLHPYQWHCLGTAVAPGVTVTNAPALQDEVVNRFFVGNAGGVDIYLDSNISVSANYAYGGMFSRVALAYDVRRAPRIEPERDASRRGYELNFSAIYAKGVWRPQYGVLIQSAGTVPV